MFLKAAWPFIETRRMMGQGCVRVKWQGRAPRGGWLPEAQFFFGCWMVLKGALAVGCLYSPHKSDGISLCFCRDRTVEHSGSSAACLLKVYSVG